MTVTRSFSMSSPVSMACSRCRAARRAHQGSSMSRPVSRLRWRRLAWGSAMAFSVRAPLSSVRMNFTSTVSAPRSEMAVCSHLNITWNLRPKGSGPASNSRKPIIYSYLTMGEDASCRTDCAARNAPDGTRDRRARAGRGTGAGESRGPVRLRPPFLSGGRGRRYGEPVPHGAGPRALGRGGEDGGWGDRLVGRRPRRARAGPLLLPLRILPHRPPQYLRQHPVPQQFGISRFLP